MELREGGKMIRTGPWENERLAKVVENYRFHLSRTGAADRMVADTARRACDIDIWEMWALTQE